MRISTVFPLLLCLQVYSQYPSLTLHRSTPAGATSFAYRNCFLNLQCYDYQEKTKTEVPPWMIAGSRNTMFFVDGRGSYAWTSTATLTQPAIDLKAGGGAPVQMTRPFLGEPGHALLAPAGHWKRNYHAVYSAQAFPHAAQGMVTLGFCHGENKNESIGDCSTGRHYQNTIQQNVPINCRDSATWSGGQPYRDGWTTYNSFLSAVWTQGHPAAGSGLPPMQGELGPIAWPSNGYVTVDGTKSSVGLRHPSSLLHGDSLYVFFVDGGAFGNNIAREEGRLEGIKVVRAHRNDALRPSAYAVYYKSPNGAVSWAPALPQGLTKENMLQFVAVKGPRSTDLFNDTGLLYQEVRFSVARVKNSDLFIGVEQYFDLQDLTPQQKPKVKVALRFSRNLTDWSKRQLLVHAADSWEASRLNYPIFLSSDGTSNTEIDLDDFYIAGSESTPTDHINKVRVYRDPALLPVPRESAGLAFRSWSLASGNNSPEAVEISTWPNPFSNWINLRLGGAAASRVRISLYNSMGQKLAVLLEAPAGGGRATHRFNLSGYAPGLYFLELLVNGVPYTKKIIRH